MRIWSVLIIVLVLISMHSTQTVNKDLDATSKSYLFDKDRKDVDVISSLSRSGVYGILSQKLNKKDALTSFSHSTLIIKQLPLSQIQKKEEFICVAVIHLFPKKFQSNYLSY